MEQNNLLLPHCLMHSGLHYLLLILLTSSGILISSTEPQADPFLVFSAIVRSKVFFTMIQCIGSARISTSAQGKMQWQALHKQVRRDKHVQMSVQRWVCRDERAEAATLGNTRVDGGRIEVTVTAFLVEQAGHRQRSRLCFSNVWFPWMGIKKSTWEGNYVEACDAQRVSADPLLNPHSMELLGQATERLTKMTGKMQEIHTPLNIRWHMLCSLQIASPRPVRLPAPLWGPESHCSHLAEPEAVPGSLLLRGLRSCLPLQ